MHETLCVVIFVALLLGAIATVVQATPEQDQQLIDSAKAGDLEKSKP